MFTSLNPEFDLAEIRERHARIRADIERSRAFREARGKHRFRSRDRRH